MEFLKLFFYLPKTALPIFLTPKKSLPIFPRWLAGNLEQYSLYPQEIGKDYMKLLSKSYFFIRSIPDPVESQTFLANPYLVFVWAGFGPS